MKKIIFALLICLFLVSLTACKGSDSKKENEEKAYEKLECRNSGVINAFQIPFENGVHILKLNLPTRWEMISREDGYRIEREGSEIGYVTNRIQDVDEIKAEAEEDAPDTEKLAVKHWIYQKEGVYRHRFVYTHKRNNAQLCLDIIYTEVSKVLCDNLFSNAKVEEYGALENEYTNYINYRAPLANTYQSLTTDKNLKVAYMGGSVTFGTGSTNPEYTSWRALSAQWLREQFPDAQIDTIHAAIGATGSRLGLYRLEADVIAKQPDLLFIEFAINDYYDGMTPEEAGSQYETIVRKIREQLPNCDIVTLYTTDWYLRGQQLHSWARAHESVAQAYNIPSINVGAALVDSLPTARSQNYNSCNECQEWMMYFTDIVHPTDNGYRKYNECLTEYLRNSLLYDVPQNVPANEIPEIQSKALLDGYRTYFGEEMRAQLVKSSGFIYSDANFNVPNDATHYGYYVSGEQSTNAEISFRFTGKEVLIWTNMRAKNDKEYAELAYAVDGGAFQTIRCSQSAVTMIAKGLSEGEHTVTIKPVSYCDAIQGALQGKMQIGGLFVR
ncbi:MAG: GDSL-type esterase/lipase family protein [Faecalimonas sp.]|nr:GDSL-type esterase/lipase family protein [Faecalimonas sp.]